MTDMSFKCWHLSINCDHPAHRRPPLPPGHVLEPDFYDVEPDSNKQAWRDDWRARGFIFHRGGRVTCPECSRLDGRKRTPSITRLQGGEGL